MISSSDDDNGSKYNKQQHILDNNIDIYIGCSNNNIPYSIHNSIETMSYTNNVIQT